MRNRTFAKDIFRSISHSWGRFWAIFAIVALGAGFFAGLNATGPDMQLTGDDYYDQNNMMDVELISTLGFTDNDISAIGQADGVQDVMAVHLADVMSEIGGEKKAIRIHGLPEDTETDNRTYLNRLALTSGRMPENPGECVIGVGKIHIGTLELGSVITLEDDGTLSDTLWHQQYKIVGFVNSAYYLSYTLGNTAIGNGTLGYYMYVPDSDFAQDVYTDVYVTMAGAKELSAFSKQYDTLAGTTVNGLETLADSREQIRYEEIRDEAQDKLSDAESDFNDAKLEANEKLADARQKLDDGQAGIDENEQKLTDAKAEIDKGERKLKSAASQISQNQKKLDTAQKQYDEGAAQLQDAWDEYNTNATALAGQKAQWQQGYNSVMAALADLDAAEADAGGDPDLIAAIEVQRAPLLAQKAALEAQKPELDAAQTQMNAVKAQLDDSQQKLDATKAQLDEGRAQLASAKKKLKSGKAQLADAKQEYEDGADQLEDAKKELADGWKEYDQSQIKAQTELNNAQAKIDDGYAQLNDLKPPEWYVLDRNDNVGFASFDADAKRMDSLSSVFPVIFFLVAALVALTTMTRMVDEERLIIGTYKALGYSNFKIASKYLIYALLASVPGGVLGVVIGFQTLPRVCWNAYLLMYTAPPLMAEFNMKFAVIGVAAATFCTLIATASVCRSALAEVPASLMLPRAPKAGKRIWLESVPFIWRRLSFTWKVTCRNLFRYKKRLIMTVVGIMGCTGLLVTGFGIKDSVSNIINYQYHHIDRYDTIIGLSDDGVSDNARKVLDENLQSWLMIDMRTADISTADGDSTLSSYIYIPSDTSRLKDFLVLRERVSQKDIPFGGGAVVITEKLAKTLGIGVGDEVAVKNDDGALVRFTVTGVAENYVYHYAYIDPALYEQRMGKPPEYNTVVATGGGDDAARRTKLADVLRNTEGISTVMFSEEISAKFNDMVKSLNAIVVVLIVCAGALAFVVLYNLTNINVTERKREIATIKVLGFYDREVTAYIYRETSLLTLIGCALGLGFGIFMHAFVIQTIEVNNVMFGRDIMPLSFVWSALLTAGFSVVVDVAMFGKLKRIGMADNLKSVD
jgi:putative ABC transport system permease protein